MKIAGIDFPEPLINALTSRKLVIFAGAGVSMGEPACLPDFKKLSGEIAEGTGETRQRGEQIDHFLGRLADKGVDVHIRAKEALSKNGLQPTELHQNLLRLYPAANQVRIVTTNFDLLFEEAAKNVFDSPPQVFQAPALPLGKRFNGIVHVHGAVGHAMEMVLTDKDFGRGYLIEGWAQRFLVDLFSNFTVLFVGYRHNDVILNYLARALPVEKRDQRFALIESDPNRWHVLGIEPITYQQSNKRNHSTLHKGIQKLADISQYNALDWKREITKIAKNPPSPEGEKADLIKYALDDETKAKFFTEVATHPEWIDWLDSHNFLNALFDNSTYSRRDFTLSQWLVKCFAYDHADKLFQLIGKYHTRLNPFFWWVLGREIGLNGENALDKGVLSRWISLLLDTVPAYYIDDESYILLRLGECCIKYEMLDNLLLVFDTMAGSRRRLREGFSLHNGDQNREGSPVDIELPLVGSHFSLDKLWKEGLQPKLPQLVEPLLNQVTKNLEKQYLIFLSWNRANRDWEGVSFRRSAIEPHEQDSHPEAVDVLIDVARDCLEYMNSEQPEMAARWRDQLVRSDVPLLRRLAVHGVSTCKDLTADGKIDWLLQRTDLHDVRVHHEIFQAVGHAYPESDSNHREALIEAVWKYECPNEDAPDKKRRTAYEHSNWFHWFNKSDPKCPLAKKALDEVLKNYSEFEPHEYQDMTHWSKSGIVEPQSPWTVEVLLAKPAAEWVDDLLEFQGDAWSGPNQAGLRANVAEAAKQKIEWGLGLAKALAEKKSWSVDFWPALIRAWSEGGLDEKNYCKVLDWFSKAELHMAHNKAIADALYALVTNGSPSYALNVLPQANRIATDLWHRLDQNGSMGKSNEWLSLAINHSAGRLAEFWLFGLSLCRESQDPKPTTLNDSYRTALSAIVQNKNLPGRLGQSILAGRFAFLLDVDEAWTKKNLLPLFEPNNDVADFQSAWDGFLTWGRLNPHVVEAMSDLFLKTVQPLGRYFSERFERFIKYYTDILVYFVENPLDKWIPTLFKSDNQEVKQNFASNLRRSLEAQNEETRHNLWKRWLKRYWENRLQGVPAPLESSEIGPMLNFLPCLTEVFPEAVGLAIQIPQEPEMPLSNCLVIHRLSESNLWQRYPEDVVKLLDYLQKFNLFYEQKDSAKKLCDKLLTSDIPPDLRAKVENIKIQL